MENFIFCAVPKTITLGLEITMTMNTDRNRSNRLKSNVRKFQAPCIKETVTEVYLRSCQTFMMEIFVKKYRVLKTPPNRLYVLKVNNRNTRTSWDT